MIARAGGLARDNPVAAGGAIVMALTGCLIVANAIGFQTGRHPAPLFSTRDWMSGQTVQDTDGWRPVDAPVVSTLVLDLQQELRRVGLYEGPLDGLAGPATDRSIRHFQRLRGMVETGEASEVLLAMVALQGPIEASAPSQSVPIPTPKPSYRPVAQPVFQASNDGDVTASIPAVSSTTVDAPALTGAALRLSKIQAILSELGYGPLVADGVMGENTSAAIRRFELDRGLPLNGDPSDTVVARLEMISGQKVD